MSDPLYSRRELLKLAALFGAGALPLLQAGALKAARTPDAPLRIGYLPITDATPLLVAHARGLFAQAGVHTLKPALFRSWASLVEAFLSQQVNLIHVLSPMSVWMRYGSQARVKALTWNHTCGSALTVRPDITDLEALQGQTVAIPFWYSVHNIIIQQLLRHAGLSVVEKIRSPGRYG